MKKYEIIYADPPWSYYNDMTVDPDCTTVKGVRRPPYKVMSSEDIKNLSVTKLFDDNAVLCLWTTDYHMRHAMDVLEAWGFTYKTVAFAWQKLNKRGKPVSFCGAYTLKSGVELCLLGTKGNTAGWVRDRKVRGLVTSERMEHSKKPDEVRLGIERLFGDRPRLELFARQKSEGWDVFGNEVEGSICCN
jgi:N6-adenosine-specific RNA methylase IME4